MEITNMNYPFNSRTKVKLLINIKYYLDSCNFSLNIFVENCLFKSWLLITDSKFSASFSRCSCDCSSNLLPTPEGSMSSWSYDHKRCFICFYAIYICFYTISAFIPFTQIFQFLKHVIQYRIKKIAARIHLSQAANIMKMNKFQLQLLQQ